MEKKKIMQFSLLIISVIFIILGILFGDLHQGIFLKAVTICLECIGIG